MAAIKNVRLKTVGTPPRAEATVTIQFSQKEQALGLEYMLWITLYDKDLGRDSQWLYPNYPYVPSQSYATTNQDDFIAHMPGHRVQPTQSEVVVILSTPLSDQVNGLEPKPRVKSAFADESGDNVLELQARAILLPETCFAVRWSGEENLPLETVLVPS
ncbi:MAG: hypothetical protein AAF152_06760 [Cyanobacteria bacterium P01_A01_bin.114]